MKIFRIPEHCRTILFDMDSTLYTNADYARSQIDLPIERLAKMKDKTFGEMNAEIVTYRKRWEDRHDGQHISLANTFAAFGVDINRVIKWRNELLKPEHYLSEDIRLRSTLELLARRFTLAVVTNNPVPLAKRTLKTLGVGDMFHTIVGLDTCGVSKPHMDPLTKAVVMCGTMPEICISVGDRYDIDIALPLELGMGGILVDGVEDVYSLPELLYLAAPSAESADHR